MEGFTPRCSEEALQKARAGLKELQSRDPVPDEFSSDEEKEAKAAAAAAKKKKKKTATTQKKKMKKKMRTLTPDDVEMILSYGLEGDPFHTPSRKEIDQLVKDDNLSDPISIGKVFAAHIDDCVRARYGDDGIRAVQERVRYEVLTKGHVTYEYEATDDEAEGEADEVAAEDGALEQEKLN